MRSTCWEHSHVGCEDAIDEVLLGQVEGALQLVVVEGDLARARAVEPCLHEGGPRILQEEPAADVVLADAGHTRVHRLAAVVLHCVFPQEEEGEESDVVGRDEVGLCKTGRWWKLSLELRLCCWSYWIGKRKCCSDGPLGLNPASQTSHRVKMKVQQQQQQDKEVLKERLLNKSLWCFDAKSMRLCLVRRAHVAAFIGPGDTGSD